MRSTLTYSYVQTATTLNCVKPLARIRKKSNATYLIPHHLTFIMETFANPTLCFLLYLQLSELEQRVVEAEERAEEAEDKVSEK